MATSRNQAAVAAVPPGAENSPMCSPNCKPVGRSCSRRAAWLREVAALTNAAGTTRTGSGVRTRSNPSPANPSRPCAQARSCAESTSAGMRFVRARLRARHSSAGVSNATATQAKPCCRASASHPCRRTASRPSVSMTVVSPRRMRRPTMSSSSANASLLAATSSSPAPTTARSRSLDTIVSSGKLAAAHVDFPDAPGPTSTTTTGAGRLLASTTPASVPDGCAVRVSGRPLDTRQTWQRIRGTPTTRSRPTPCRAGRRPWPVRA